MARFARWFRWAFFSGGPLSLRSFSSTLSTLALTANPFDAGTGTTLTGTVRDTAGNTMAGKAFTNARTLDAIDVSAAVVTVSPDEIPDDDTTTALITISNLVYVSDGAAVANFPLANILAVSNGTGNTIAAIGTHTSASGIGTWSIRSSVDETKTISASIFGKALTDTASLVVTSGAPTVTLERANAWSTGLGSAEDELRDVGSTNPIPWVRRSSASVPSNTQLEVIANPGTLGFPAALVNIVQLEYDQQISQLVGAAGSGFGDSWFNALAVGDTQWIRFYFRNDLPNGVNIGGTDHGFETDISGTGGLQFYMHVKVGSSDKWDISFGTTATGNNSEAEYGFTLEGGARLDKGKCYRIAIGRTRTGTTTYVTAIHIYDEAVSTTVPAYTTTDFELDQPGATPSIPLEDYEWITVDATRAFRQWVMGTSGQVGATYQGGTVYFGAIAVSQDGEPMAYVLGEGQ